MKELLRAAFVVARRDFTAIIFSKAFILFLIGPLLPLGIGVVAGGLGQRMATESLRPVVGITLSAADAQAMEGAQQRLKALFYRRPAIQLRRYAAGQSPEALLARKGERINVVLSGTLDRPVLTGRQNDIDRMQGDIALIASIARAGNALPETPVTTRIVADSSGAEQQARLITGRIAQILLFLLTMLLAGMVLSNMVEEKTNKIIEVLAAAIPVDAIFLGKLMAMLAMSFVGISVWASATIAAYGLFVGGSFPLPPPALGWPLFLALAILYFATAYTLLGALFIGIGAQAATVRDVQTISMPITMTQVMFFFLASFNVDRMGQPMELLAVAFPFSSPFAMIARAAQSDALLPHVAALVWQWLWVALIIRIGVRLFRRNVLKSGSGVAKKRLFSRFRKTFSRSGT